MSTDPRLGFRLQSTGVRDLILIPKYYDPMLDADVEDLRGSHQLLTLRSLADSGHIELSTGHEVGKMAYGTGSIPFVRTSDITNWEIKADPKQSVSEEIYDRYAARQDVQAGDILLVRDGTYLIGAVAMVSESDLPLLYQSHIVRIRVNRESPVSNRLLLAALSCDVVQRQFQARRFTADIIDTLGDRYLDVAVPIPRDPDTQTKLSSEVWQIVNQRAAMRSGITSIPLWAEGQINSLGEDAGEPRDGDPFPTRNLGFQMPAQDLTSNVLIPKYYAPQITADLEGLKTTHRLVKFSDLIADGVVSWRTGVEPGKMAYGTGEIPFVRTSDLTNWELKAEPKQSVSEEILAQHRERCDIRARDILLVRDGTYLVGTSAMVLDDDLPMLYAGGLYRFRVEDRAQLSPHLLLAVLNMPIVRRQMRAFQFTRNIIDTLGKRVFEVQLPFPRSAKRRDAITSEVRRVIDGRARLREGIAQIAKAVES